MTQVALMYVQIACARTQRAKTMKVLTFAPSVRLKSTDNTNANQDGMHVPKYFVHTDEQQSTISKLKLIPPFTRKLRYRYGELAWDSLSWYFQKLRWPSDDSSLGVTWVELALDFEISTGVVLPRGPAIRENSGGSRLRGRQATWARDPNVANASNKLQHSIEKLLNRKLADLDVLFVAVQESGQNEIVSFGTHVLDI